MVGFDPGSAGGGVHGRGLDHSMRATERERAKKNESLYVEATKVSIRRFGDWALCRSLT